ncbi:hypothetical protein D3C85_1338290 [compost metagenome]
MTSVRNERDAQWVCNASGVAEAPSGGASRGTTDCSVMGKIVRLDDAQATVRTVIGRVATPSGTDDITALRDADLTLHRDSQSYPVEWGAKMEQISNAPMATTILIVRSPTSGAIRTFIKEGDITETPAAMIAPANLQKGTSICMDSDGMFIGKRFSVEFLPNASSSAGVKVHGDGTTPC